MEERIIDDEYGRGIRLKKTKDGYIDVTDELAQEGETTETEGEFEEEIAFEFPVFETDEDDEDLVGLTPEQAVALRKQKEEEAARRKAEYERVCKEGEELLASGSFKAAELKFEKALALDDEATDASVGYWRAKTSDFKDPDVLIGEYAEAGIESLTYDLGYNATERIKKEFRSNLKKRVKELEAEEEPLFKSVEEKRSTRREILTARVKKATAIFLGVTLPTVALLVLTIIIGLKNVTTRDNTFVLPTILLGVGFFLCFIAFIFFTNKWLNALRMRRANEKLSSTEDGARLKKLMEYKDLYLELLQTNENEETAE